MAVAVRSWEGAVVHNMTRGDLSRPEVALHRRPTWAEIDRLVFWWCPECGRQMGFRESIERDVERVAVAGRPLLFSTRIRIREMCGVFCPRSTCGVAQFSELTISVMRSLSRVGDDRESAWRFFCYLYDAELVDGAYARGELGQGVG